MLFLNRKEVVRMRIAFRAEIYDGLHKNEIARVVLLAEIIDDNLLRVISYSTISNNEEPLPELDNATIDLAKRHDLPSILLEGKVVGYLCGEAIIFGADENDLAILKQSSSLTPGR